MPQKLPPHAIWIGERTELRAGATAFKEAVSNVGKPIYIVAHDEGPAITHHGTMVWGEPLISNLPSEHLLGFAPPLPPANLGDPEFKKDLGLRYAYVVGAMANGITSVELVRAAGEAGMIGFFGTGGLPLHQVERAIDRLSMYREVFPYGFNLIHSPSDPQLESAVVDLFISRGVQLVEASAYLALTLPLVYFRVKGIHQRPDGCIVCPNRVVAKVSRVEVASRFFAPPPPKMLNELVRLGKVTQSEAQLAGHIPLAQEITGEADSGGHTDNRPALTLLPTFLSLRDEAMRRYQFNLRLRVGLGGGIATPEAAAAAFAMGAAYVLTGSINQACKQADTSQTVREMLGQAAQADVAMAPAADMFEMGVKVQVLKRGTMFAMRAAKLYELYRNYDHYDQLPQQARTTVERDFLRSSFEQAWQQTKLFFQKRDPSQIERAERDPKHQMALVFRSYLGQSSMWAKTGDPSRKMDYQIWCGPSMGAFNAWVKDSFLEDVTQRCAATIGLNLLYGAAGLIRCSLLRNQGVTVPRPAAIFKPITMEEIEKRLQA
ncbi:MAG: PfaD family polyunsaturated fatty acid/polyketide biosynthesis protein [Desulfobacteraceae bacterium]|nr:MAG: PfaD family polyunsaturated fatty acid/polyketide biosynthesis protein [Desulfobacteraceae bacterium]